MKVSKAKLSLFIHLLTAFVLLLKGIDKTTHAHLLSGITLIGLALAILLLLLLEKKVHLNHHTVKQACLLIESTALFIIAFVFYQEGRQYLQYVFGISALAYLAVAFMHYKKDKQSSH
ncbi:hypothetical protein [uncultured Pontibacter sp.]|uniref:hypothetical protein n=1 Tax=uncultured Pontibacter sp. TaxID=453356 RepID=UPI002610747B|nr:hypothetical protein [uncultured Pontibacter sp.]